MVAKSFYQENRPTSRMPERKYAYFRDDQVVCILKHGQTLESNQRSAFDTAVGTAVKELQSRSIEKPPQWISFPAMTGQEIEQMNNLPDNYRLTSDEVDKIKSGFSIVKYDLNNDEQDPANLLPIVEGLQQELETQFKTDELKLEGVLPNWLTSVTAQGGGTGGPGGKPSPYYGSRKNAPYHLNVKKLLQEANGGDLYGDGSGVSIAILDTAPSAQALVSAYKEWPDHPLIATLLGPTGKLRLYPASYDDHWRMNCTSLNDHDYKMTDHGLFIAGLIHSIVPEAEIHLVEVLNQYGVGDYMSFVQGLIKLYTEKIYRPDRQLVINCSWMLEFPREDRQSRHKDPNGDPDAIFAELVRQFAGADQSLPFALRELFNRFYALGRQAVAAAGNDGRKEDADGVLARYPAALTRVQGVGSLPKSLERGGNGKYKTSVFSNLSDNPDRKGIATLGGEEGEGKGVLGLYIGEFPGCCRNDSKWAWWSGTSFATPILAGTIASVMSRAGNEAPTTQHAIEKLYAPGAKIIEDGQARVREDALPVTQS